MRHRMSAGLAIVWLGFMNSFARAIPSYTKVAYFSFSSSNTFVQPSGGTLLPRVTQADDSPFAEVALPWSFPLLGVSIQSIWVSPNGALFATEVPPTKYSKNKNEQKNPNVFVDPSTSNFNTISGFATDLNPGQGQSSSSRVTTYALTDSVVVSYTEVPLFNSSVHIVKEVADIFNTFHIALFSDGQVNVHYEKIVALEKLEKNGFTYISGLMDFTNLTDLSRTLYNGEQLNRRSMWNNTAILGVYPDKSQVTSSRMFTACPVSTSWTLAPSTLDSFPNSTSSALLTLTPLSLGCVHAVQYSIFLRGHSDIPPVPCSVGPSNVSASVQSLSCNATSFLSLGNGSYSLAVRWATSAVQASPSSGELNIADLTLTLMANATGNCTSNALLPQCDSCALVAGNFTCLDLPCDDVFSPPDLGPNCIDDSCVQSTGLDLYDDCCSFDDMDCTGLCNGLAVEAFTNLTTIKPGFSSANQSYCCVEADCNGVCGGPALQDVCKVCFGTAKTYRECALQVGLQVTDSRVADPLSNTDDVYPLFNLTSSFRVLTFTLTNLNQTTPIRGMIRGIEPEDIRMGPVFDPLEVSSPIHLAAASSVTFRVNVSFETVMNGRLIGWSARSIVFDLETTTKGEYYATTREVRVLPAFTNCSSILDRDVCVRVPACIFCLRYPDARFLQAVDNGAQTRRSLYVDIVPPSNGYGFREFDYKAYGVCTDGWDTDTTCRPEILSLFAAASPNTLTWPILNFLSSIAVLFAFVLL